MNSSQAQVQAAQRQVARLGDTSKIVLAIAALLLMGSMIYVPKSATVPSLLGTYQTMPLGYTWLWADPLAQASGIDNPFLSGMIHTNVEYFTVALHMVVIVAVAFFAIRFLESKT